MKIPRLGSLFAAMGLLATLVVAAPIAASASARAWFGSPDGSGGFYGNMYLPRGMAVSANFGVSGMPEATDLEVTMDLSPWQGRVVFDSVSSGTCSISGLKAFCHGAPDSSGSLWIGVYLKALSSAPLGPVGRALVTSAQGGSAQTLPTYIEDRALGVDMEITSTNPSGRVGDVVDAVFTVRNHGPNVQPFWGLTGLSVPNNTQLLSLSGCSGANLRGVYYECGFTTPLQVGAAVVITVRMKITAERETPGGRSGGGFQVFEWLLDDPNHRNETQRFTVNVTGSGSSSGGGPTGGGSSNGSSGGGANGGAVNGSPVTGVPSAVDSLAPSPDASTTASGKATSSSQNPVSSHPVAGESKKDSGIGVLPTTAAGLTVLALLAAATWRLRARRPASGDHPDEPTP